MAKKWTETEMAFIRDSFLYKSNREIGEHFGVSAKSIEMKLRRMRLKREYRQPRNKVETRKKLSTAEVERLRREAIQLLDDGLRSISMGEEKEARWQLAKVVREYPDIIDIASAAKEYIQRLKTKQ